MKEDLTRRLDAIPMAGPWDVTPVRGGVVNSSWKVENASEAFFLKLQRSDDRNQIDRSAEVSLQKQLSERGLCPAVRYASESHDLVLFDWVAAPSLESASLPERDKMRLLATTMARIHASEPEFRSWSLYDRIMHYCNNLAAQLPARAEAYYQRLQHFSELIRDWDRHPGCLCHNDLSLGHVLLSEPVQVVDWEYAGYGHPYFDIASCIEINELSSPQVQLFCRYYSEAAGKEITRGEIATWRALVGILNELWFALQKI